ncbi:putative cardiolipin synthase [Modicisalibacter xianhensis]|uniref:Putative cardiolipin synthase n=2 Tax=Modicisalibacter xianhensis TaxID=442341 RepID=A0A4R8FHJ6_9GAMM|nr:putative cardiolipin synthase [Halomonas xianhensis]
MGLLGGCTSMDVVSSPSQALSRDAARHTYLGAWAHQAEQRHEAISGMTLVSDGPTAFALRASLAAHAQKTLDVQTYILEDDRTGRALLRQMLQAAQRGVRVRLLLDDLTSRNKQAMLAAFDSHPNIEVRVFNPITAGRATRLTYYLALVANFDRKHRRMHNKLWVTDNAVAITGGRNLGDEYFEVDDELNFNDLDVMAVGPVVATLSGSFDSYWNHPLAVPLRQFASARNDAWHDLLVALGEDAAQGNALSTQPAFRRMVGESGRRLLDSLVWAPAIALWDSPHKLAVTGYPPFGLTVMDQLEGAFRRLDDEMLIISPYVIPTQAGIDYLKHLAQRGVRLTVLTNSLEATDVPSLHGAYAPWRPAMLKQGARLHELRGNPVAAPERAVGEISSLHTKAVAFDQDRVFIGSLNADPRSLWWNSELGLLIDSRELGQQLWDLARQGMSPTRSYQVTLDEDSSLRWETRRDGQWVTTGQEPGGLWRHLKAKVLRLLPIEHLL